MSLSQFVKSVSCHSGPFRVIAAMASLWQKGQEDESVNTEMEKKVKNGKEERHRKEW